MEEAEVCCQKIGIMAKGTMRCFGSSAHLKNLYGAGYEISIHFKEENTKHAVTFVSNLLPKSGTRCYQESGTYRQYVFRPTGDELANIFESMTHQYQKHGIISWGLNQSTLDEIFTVLISEQDAS